jgi:ribonuclease HI
MIQYLLALLSLRATRGEDIIFEHVRGHSNNVGNDGADALAKQGTTEPIIPERDWCARRKYVELIEARITSSESDEE